MYTKCLRAGAASEARNNIYLNWIEERRRKKRREFFYFILSRLDDALMNRAAALLHFIQQNLILRWSIFFNILTQLTYFSFHKNSCKHLNSFLHNLINSFLLRKKKIKNKNSSFSYVYVDEKSNSRTRRGAIVDHWAEN